MHADRAVPVLREEPEHARDLRVCKELACELNDAGHVAEFYQVLPDLQASSLVAGKLAGGRGP